MIEFEALRIYLQKGNYISGYLPQILIFRQCRSRQKLEAEIKAKEASLNRGLSNESKWNLIYSRIAEREDGSVRLLALLSNGKESPEIEEEF